MEATLATGGGGGVIFIIHTLPLSWKMVVEYID